MQICLKCGVEISPAGACSHCGERLGIATSSQFRGLVTSTGAIVERSTRLDELEHKKKQSDAIGKWVFGVILASFALALAMGAFAILAPLLVAALGISIIGGIHHAMISMELSAARRKENDRLKILASAKRTCSQCHASLPPTAIICSNCGGTGILITT